MKRKKKGKKKAMVAGCLGMLLLHTFVIPVWAMDLQDDGTVLAERLEREKVIEIEEEPPFEDGISEMEPGESSLEVLPPSEVIEIEESSLEAPPPTGITTDSSVGLILIMGAAALFSLGAIELLQRKGQRR